MSHICVSLVLIILHVKWKWHLTLFGNIFELINICGLSQDNILLEPLRYNNKIKVKKSIFYKSLYNKGFHTVSDLTNSQGIFITYECITIDFLVKLPFTVYEGLKHSILCAFPEVKYLDPHSI